MKNLFKKAHKMTREMVEKYGVDYQAQFGLNLSYLLEKEEEKEMLKGTEKQIKWAEDIIKMHEETLEEIKEVINEDTKEERKVKNTERVEQAIEEINSIENAADIIDRFKDISAIKDEIERAWKIKKSLKENFDINISAKYFKGLEEKIWNRREAQ